MAGLKCDPSKLPSAILPTTKPFHKVQKVSVIHIPKNRQVEERHNKCLTPRKKVYTPEVDAKILQMHGSGMTVDEIAAEMKLVPGGVEARLWRLEKESGQGTSRAWTTEEDSTIVSMRDAGAYWKTIAEKLGRSDSGVRKRYLKLKGEKGAGC